jgi:hypothetical protein
MGSHYDSRTFDDSPLLTIDSDDESRDSDAPGLELYKRSVEKKLAADTDPARIATVRETMQRLLSRTNSPEKNHQDYYLIVRYLLHGRLE